MKCLRCQHENAPRMKFCGECGTPLTANPSGSPPPSYAELTSALSEAQEQQTATREILRVIASSPTDLQPVLDAMAESAASLCIAHDATILRLAGDNLHVAAHHGPIPNPVGLVIPVIRGTVSGRSLLERQTVQVADVQAAAEAFPVGGTFAREFGYRTILSGPLLREGVPIGAIALRRIEVQPFTDRQIELLQTFADQAVIAIENVRLFEELQARNRELTESLEQQMASGEILQAISNSPTDVQPVFEAIVKNSVRLCEGLFGALYRFEGDTISFVAHHNISADGLAAIHRQFPMSPNRETWVGRAILDRTVIHVPDVADEPQFKFMRVAEAIGYRSALAVPLLREGRPIGVIRVSRAEAKPFSDGQVALVKTFADQAVIAIENVRLFRELEARNRDLTEALEQQTATSEILGVISSSPTDVQPVFDTIAASALRLCDARWSAVIRFDGQVMELASLHGLIVYLKAKDSWADRLRFCDRYARQWLRVALTPTARDLALLPLPARLAFVYCLVRPFRVAVERGWSGAARRYRRPAK